MLDHSKACFIRTSWKKKRETRDHRTKVPKRIKGSHCVLKNTSPRKLCKKMSLHFSSQECSLKEINSESHLFSNDSSHKNLSYEDSSHSWKQWKNESIHSQISVLREFVSWKLRKKKWNQISSLKSVLGTRASSLKRSLTWTCQKKKRFQHSSTKSAFGP